MQNGWHRLSIRIILSFLLSLCGLKIEPIKIKSSYRYFDPRLNLWKLIIRWIFIGTDLLIYSKFDYNVANGAIYLWMKRDHDCARNEAVSCSLSLWNYSQFLLSAFKVIVKAPLKFWILIYKIAILFW